MQSRAIVALVILSLAACSQPPSARSERKSGPAPGTLVTVNGVAITEADLELALRPRSHEADDPAEGAQPSLTSAQKKAVLETLVQQELEAQRAKELELDRDPAYREGLAKVQASVDAFRRQKLGELYARHEREAANVTDADARRYFEEHEQELQTELHVLQILMREEGRIEEAHRAIRAGKSLEDVAAELFPGLPAGTRPPWDLGFLRYNQLPEAWRGVVDRLEKGQTSGVIRGPRNRFWLVKVVDRRRNTSLGFDTWRPNIITMLREERLTEGREEAARALRQKAQVRYVRDPRK